MKIEELGSNQTLLEKKPLIEDISKIEPSPARESINFNIAQSAEKHEGGKFRFNHIERATLPGFNDKLIQENLFKWGMQEHMYLKRFSYDQYLNPLEIDEFLLQFFNDPSVNPHMRVRFINYETWFYSLI